MSDKSPEFSTASSGESVPQMEVSTVASALAAMFLAETASQGKTIEIPSLGIGLGAANLPREAQHGTGDQPSNHVSAVTSGLAGMFLRKTVESGDSIEIPSLGITLTSRDLPTSELDK